MKHTLAIQTSTLRDLVKQYGSPLYVYDLDGLRARLKFFRAQSPKNSRAFFALKSNNNPGVIKVLREEGFGVDIVSGGELAFALEMGFKPEQIIFSGVAKSVAEITQALEVGVAQINIESAPELERVAKLASQLKKKARVALRMNPDIEAKTHPYIRTGFRDNKFGLDFSEISNLLAVIKHNSAALELRGLTLHIGSQIREIEPFAAAMRKTLELYKSIVSSGFDLKTFDVGGGVGIDYNNADYEQDEKRLAEYMAIVSEAVAPFVNEVLFEPGRILVARFGTLITEVQYVKRTPYKSFLIVNTGMHHLMRPALYQAFHAITPVGEFSGGSETFDVVGPICESSDVVGSARYLPSSLTSGDLLAIHDVGAYGAVMSSQYNMHSPVKEICVSGERIV